MATSTTKSNPKVEKKYAALDWSKSSMPGCCGVGVPCSFNESEWEYDYSRWDSVKQRKKAKLFATKEEQALHTVTAMEEWGRDEKYVCLLVTLVEQYADGTAKQFPELSTVMLDNGWRVEREWVAPRHGNKLRLYSKVLDNWENAECKEPEDDDDEDDDF